MSGFLDFCRSFSTLPIRLLAALALVATLSLATTAPAQQLFPFDLRCAAFTSHWEAEAFGGGTLRQGDDGNLYFELLNPNNTLTLTTGTATLDPVNWSHAVPLNSIVEIPLIEPGERQMNIEPFMVAISEDAPCTIEFRLTYTVDAMELSCSLRVFIRLGELEEDVVQTAPWGEQWEATGLWRLDTVGDCLANAGSIASPSGSPPAAYNHANTCDYAEEGPTSGTLTYMPGFSGELVPNARYYLTFWHLFDVESFIRLQQEIFFEDLQVQVSDGEGGWVTIAAYGGRINWMRERIHLDPYISGQENFQVRFLFDGDGFDGEGRLGWYIDDVRVVRELGDCISQGLEPPVYTRRFIFEEVTGNGNGHVDPGETGDLFLEFRNPNREDDNGQSPAGLLGQTDKQINGSGSDGFIPPFQGRLETEDPLVTILEDTAIWPGLKANARAFNQTPFLIEVDPARSCEPIVFILHLTGEFPPTSTTVTIPIGSPVETILFSDDFESGSEAWTMSGLWHLQQDSPCLIGAGYDPYISPNTVAAYNRFELDGNCDFNTGQQTIGSLVMIEPVLVPADSLNPLLRWEEFVETENDSTGNGSFIESNSTGITPKVDDGTTEAPWDQVEVSISNNEGETWDVIRFNAINTNGWVTRFFWLDDYRGDEILVRFRFDSVDSIANNFLGWFIDDVAILDIEYVCDPFQPTPTPTPTPTATPTPLPPCPTGTPVVITPTATPTPTPTPTPSPTPQGPVILTIDATETELVAEHSGLAPGARHFIAFWTRRMNDAGEPWVYYGFVEYFPGETITTMPWAPLPNSRYDLSARIWVDGQGWLGDHARSVYTDFENPFLPTVTSMHYDEVTQEVVVNLTSGTLPAQIGFWYRPVDISPDDLPPQATIELVPWVYTGFTHYPLLAEEVRIPFDRFTADPAGDVHELAARVYQDGTGFVGDNVFNYAPGDVTAYARPIAVWLNNDRRLATVRLSPVGNTDALVGLWFREIDPFTCEPVCGWTFLGFKPAPHLGRSLEYDWFPENPNGVFEGAARLYVDDGEFQGWASDYAITQQPCPTAVPF